MGLRLRRQQTAACEGFFAQPFCVRVQKLQHLRRSQFVEAALDEEVCGVIECSTLQQGENPGCITAETMVKTINQKGEGELFKNLCRII